jgi:hypothetical protein
MPKHSSTSGRKARALQKQTGVPYTQALAQVQREGMPVSSCPECGGYDLDTEHVGGGRLRAACNDCPWIDT